MRRVRVSGPGFALVVCVAFGLGQGGCSLESSEARGRIEKSFDEDGLPVLPDFTESPPIVIEQERSRYYPSSSYIVPNEEEPWRLQPLMADLPRGGLCISVGSERALFTAYHARCAALYVLDINAATLVFHRINRSLLWAAATREEYRHLRLNASLDEWRIKLGSDDLRETQRDFDWWSEFVRRDPDHLLHRICQRSPSANCSATSPFPLDGAGGEANYLASDSGFSFVRHIMADPVRRMRAYLVDLRSTQLRAEGYRDRDSGRDVVTVPLQTFSHLSQRLEAQMREGGAPRLPPLAVLDVSNMFSYGNRCGNYAFDFEVFALHSLLSHIEPLMSATNDADAPPTRPILVLSVLHEQRQAGFDTAYVSLDLRSYVSFGSEAARRCCLWSMGPFVSTQIGRGERSVAFSCDQVRARCADSVSPPSR